jgi:ATP phosphoribosyltransferase
MRIAIPKGRLQDKTLALFKAAGYDVPNATDIASRRLVFDAGGVEWILVKDCDVPVYVEHGAADAGVAGLDQLLEHGSTSYQPVELPFGACRMMLIGAPGADAIPTKIATKYPRIASEWAEARGLHVEIIPLGGSVELAAVLNLTSHVIDLVETGETARIHNLQLQELVTNVSPRLIVGKDVYRTATAAVRDLIARVAFAVEERTYETEVTGSRGDRPESRTATRSGI